MTHIRRSVLAVAPALVVCWFGDSANGAYQGMYVRLHTSVLAGGEMRDVWRVYATFTEQADFLAAVFGSPTVGPLHIQTVDASSLFPGGDFYNPGGDPAITWDTAVAIGEGFLAPDGAMTAGFPQFINGSQLLTSTAGWYAIAPSAQGMAGNGTALPGGLWGVLAMQLTVNAGNHVRGTVAVQGINNNPLAGGSTFLATHQTFNSIPAPGTVIVLGLVGLTGARRRRR